MKFYQNMDTVEWAILIRQHPDMVQTYNGHTKQSRIRGMEHMWFKDNRVGEWGIEDSRQCNSNWLRGDHTSYFTKHKAVLNLKHVPKSIKDADYGSFTDWMAAVWKHISAARAKAKFKAEAKETNRKTEQALEFMNFKHEMESVVEPMGYKPTTDIPNHCKELGLHTWNEVWANHPNEGWRKDSVQFKKGKLKMTADIQRCYNKLTIQGIPSDKVRSVLAKVCEMLND